MHTNQKKISVAGIIVLFLVLLNVIIIKQGMIAHSVWYKAAYITVPLLLIALVLFRRKRM